MTIFVAICILASNQTMVMVGVFKNEKDCLVYVGKKASEKGFKQGQCVKDSVQ